jgi:class 3 adenylate cyclase
MLAKNWGTESFISRNNPSWADDIEGNRLAAKMGRASATPRSAAAQYDYYLRNLDVRSALPLVQVPTLVLHVQDSPLMPLAFGQYLADHIPGATLVELPGSDLGTPTDEAMAQIAEFLTGERPSVEIERILTTVLFTDIVGSTQRATEMGDRRWSALLDAHDRAVRGELRRFKGREINTTGDGFIVAFDGPARAIRCAQALLASAEEVGLEFRIGVHTGECEVRGEDLAGLTIHIAARVGAMAQPNEVLVSGTIKDLVVGSGIEFEDRGEHVLKGVPGTWRVFAVDA